MKNVLLEYKKADTLVVKKRVILLMTILKKEKLQLFLRVLTKTATIREKSISSLEDINKNSDRQGKN